MGHYWRDMFPDEAAEQDKRINKFNRLKNSKDINDNLEALKMSIENDGHSSSRSVDIIYDILKKLAAK